MFLNRFIAIQFETLRLRQVEVEKARSEAAGALEAVREQLIKWEKDLGKMSDATAEIDSAEIAREFLPMKEAAFYVIDALKGVVGRAKEARERSDQIQAEYLSRRGKGR